MLHRFHLRNKTCFPCLHSLVKTEANVWENSRANQWKPETQSAWEYKERQKNQFSYSQWSFSTKSHSFLDFCRSRKKMFVLFQAKSSQSCLFNSTLEINFIKSICDLRTADYPGVEFDSRNLYSPGWTCTSLHIFKLRLSLSLSILFDIRIPYFIMYL